MEDLKIIGGIFGVVAVVMTAVFCFAATMSKGECRNTASIMGAEYQWGFNTPCMVKLPGKPWLPLHSIRTVN